MTHRRARLLLIFGGLVAGGAALLAWTQPWFTLLLREGERLVVAGQVAAPALSALGLASLALAAALAIAGRVVRVVLGLIELAIGVLMVVSVSSALGDPVAASAQAVTDATAISGAESIAAIVTGVGATAWPGVGIAAGAVAAVVGMTVTLTSHRWPGATRKYETTAGDDTAGSLGAWDALSGGADPTSGSR